MNPYFTTRTVIAENGCWEWTLYRSPQGYGRAAIRSHKPVSVLAHRLSYELHVGPIPVGMTVDHMCFNPSCVRPDHLRVAA